jgi:hypothetical protein
MAKDLGVIWDEGKEEYFLMMDLTGKSLICLTGTMSAVERSTDLPTVCAEVRF